jgi:hypothetical protein
MLNPWKTKVLLMQYQAREIRRNLWLQYCGGDRINFRMFTYFPSEYEKIISWYANCLLVVCMCVCISVPFVSVWKVERILFIFSFKNLYAIGWCPVNVDISS